MKKAHKLSFGSISLHDGLIHDRVRQWRENV